MYSSDDVCKETALYSHCTPHKCKWYNFLEIQWQHAWNGLSPPCATLNTVPGKEGKNISKPKEMRGDFLGAIQIKVIASFIYFQFLKCISGTMYVKKILLSCADSTLRVLSRMQVTQNKTFHNFFPVNNIPFRLFPYRINNKTDNILGK